VSKSCTKACRARYSILFWSFRSSPGSPSIVRVHDRQLSCKTTPRIAFMPRMHACRYQPGGKLDEGEVDLDAIEADIKRMEDELGPEERAQYEDLKAKLNRDDIPWQSPYDTVRPLPCFL
jgi:hypothetical protein